MDRHDFGRAAAFGSEGHHMWIAGAAALLIGLVLWKLRQLRLGGRRQPVVPIDTAEEKGELQPDLTIEPLPKFNWKEAEPRKFRPFRPVYHITMALQSTALSDLIIVDKNYLNRINWRKELLATQGSLVHNCLPPGRDAVREVYSFILGEYLPTRYPTMFQLTPDGSTFHNLVTGREYPSEAAADGDMDAALRVIGENTDDDMFILRETPEGHVADAFMCCCPAGFDPYSKLGKLLKDIHKPVPSYEKIGKSMEKFFSRAEVGKGARRINWSIQTNDELFKYEPHATLANSGADQKNEFRLEETYVRMELQTLTRLPKTRSLMFSFKTYLYPISEIKAEGTGPELATAIEGLKAGNAPGMWTYKGGAKWAERVCEYLRE